MADVLTTDDKKLPSEFTAVALDDADVILVQDITTGDNKHITKVNQKETMGINLG
jgi:hypothetical protein